MNKPLDQIDPQWAWSAWKPDAQRPWDRRAAAHLWRRGGFGATSRELDEAVKAGPAATVRKLVESREDEAFRAQVADLSAAVLATGNPRSLASWWLYRMVYSPCPLHEQMTLLWHGHFATSGAKVTEAGLLLDQHDLLRRHALGRFGEMAHGIARDPAMLLYLDSATNRRSHPNENFARELMELFCLGLGHYTERDIQELARCFTGWEIHEARFRFNRFQHDPGEKRFLGKQGSYGGDEGVDVVLAQDAVAPFIVRKVLKHLVCDEPELPETLVAPLADSFRASGYDLAHLVAKVLESQFFYSEHCVGRLVRSPVALAVGWLRSLHATTNVQQLAEELGRIGQMLFFPPNVKGWPGGRAWLNSATIVGRANLVRRLADGGSTKFAAGSLVAAVEQLGGKDTATTVDRLLELLVALPVAPRVRDELAQIAAAPGDRSRALSDLLHAISLVPEFQLA